jgi:sialidase-1
MRQRAAAGRIWMCIALCGAPLGAQQRATVVDLEHSGEGYPVFRIPALAVTTRGTLIAAYDGRPSGDDLPSHIVVLVRRSTDGGKRWLPRQVVRGDSAPAGYGDPSLLVDRQTGRIFLFYAATVRQGFFGSAKGNREDDPDVQQADYSWSDDDGITWHPRRITAAIKDPAWAGLFASSGAGVQLEHGPHKGRLIQQYTVRIEGKHFAASAFSDDHGQSWRMGALVGPGVDENKSVELSDGRLMLNSRAKPVRKIAFSDDGGESWHDLHDEPALIDPANNGAIVRADVRAPPGKAPSHWLLFSNTEDSAKRVNLVVKLSCDDGKSWSGRRVIEPGSSAYSTLAVLPDGSVAVLYERANYGYISFTRFPIKTLAASCR